jgi:hypothetical protein
MGEKGKTDLANIISTSKNLQPFYVRQADNKMLTIDYYSRKSLPVKTKIHCFWCRHSFDTSPLGCPIHYFDSNYIEKWKSKKSRSSIISSVVDDTYSDSFSNFFKELDQDGILLDRKVQESGIFVVVKNFCSFNCIQAFLLEEMKKNNLLYSQSHHLLSHMYKELNGEYPKTPINPAHSFTLLIPYGGVLTIKDFRKSFLTVKYKEQNNKCMPLSYSFTSEITF